MAERPPLLSVVVPVYREEARIRAVLRQVLAQALACPELCAVEVLVVDGDPEALTLAALDSDAGRGVRETCAAAGVTLRLLHSPAGRGRQLDLGARTAAGELLLFLHADTELEPGAFGAVVQALAAPDIVGGAFALGYCQRGASPLQGAALRVVAWCANLRCRLSREPFGDQALFLRREAYLDLGGFAHLPLMEDLEFMRRLRRKGGRIVLLPQRAWTSARRYQELGVLRCALRNILLRLGYNLGVPPEALALWYRRQGD